MYGLSGLVGSTLIMSSCSNESENLDDDPNSNGDCSLTPTEVEGPFPNLTPAQLARENIIVDRQGVAFLIQLTVLNEDNDCQPLQGAIIDLWHCDSEGNYSQYGDTFLQEADYRDADFLRGRQVTNGEGKASYVSIFPGWYAGRAPHIHLEILDANENSLLITQLAFPKEVCDVVYDTEHYTGEQDTTNETDMFFSDGFSELLLDSLEGNITDGYTMQKTVIVSTT